MLNKFTYSLKHTFNRRDHAGLRLKIQYFVSSKQIKNGSVKTDYATLNFNRRFLAINNLFKTSVTKLWQGSQYESIWIKFMIVLLIIFSSDIKFHILYMYCLVDHRRYLKLPFEMSATPLNITSATCLKWLTYLNHGRVTGKNNSIPARFSTTEHTTSVDVSSIIHQFVCKTFFFFKTDWI